MVGRETGTGFRHEALWYRGEHGFLESVAAAIDRSSARGEPVLVATDAGKIEGLRSRLGGHIDGVGFVDMRVAGRNPARLIPTWREFVDAHPGAPVLGIGEPVWAGRSDEEIAECVQHEELLNLAFADVPTFRLTCPYDLAALEADAVASSERSHPFIDEAGATRSSPMFAGPGWSSHALGGGLPRPVGEAEERSFDGTDLATLRSWVAAAATKLGLPGDGVDDLVLSVSEVASNSVRHGGGTGRARVWSNGRSVVCEIDDDGWIRDPLVGRIRPLPAQGRGYGLWMVNQLCDLVQIRSSARGTKVRLHVALDRRP